MILSCSIPICMNLNDGDDMLCPILLGPCSVPICFQHAHSVQPIASQFHEGGAAAPWRGWSVILGGAWGKRICAGPPWGIAPPMKLHPQFASLFPQQCRPLCFLRFVDNSLSSTCECGLCLLTVCTDFVEALLSKTLVLRASIFRSLQATPRSGLLSSLYAKVMPIPTLLSNLRL